MDLTTNRIRTLNDELRRNLPNCHAIMTTGIAALGPEAVARIIKTVAVYDDFCHANDPHEEHDFGSFEADGHVIFFKIDYFDKALAYHSPGPSDPSAPERAITIMLAEEYEPQRFPTLQHERRRSSITAKLRSARALAACLRRHRRRWDHAKSARYRRLIVERDRSSRKSLRSDRMSVIPPIAAE